MDVCTAKSTFNPPLSNPRLIISKHTESILQWKTHYPLSLKQTSICLSNPGVRYYKNSSVRSTTSEETSSEATSHVKDETDFQSNEAPQEDSLMDNPMQVFQFLEKLNIEFDYEEAYSFLVFGGGGVVLYWIAAAIVNAIDSVPVFPKVLELVGLAYTLWFTIRYLIFKKNRDELVVKVEEIKQQILGSQDN
ncbi:protein CURVATURE THYLAKOID 1D [Forsythia ovata]|uniref:Protein CURVATURE THYLAKOID 1D n=1 Tax=Forsythia ovata TaxID=205694 RepID=A0ABD1UT20_9LAMI